MGAVVLLLAPLLAVAQPRPREARPDRSPERSSSADRSRGDMQVVNDWRDAVSLVSPQKFEAESPCPDGLPQ